MGNLGFQELLVIAVIALLVVGPERLPEFARKAGRFVSRLREETTRGMDELKRVAEVEDLDQELRAMRDELEDTGRQLRDTIQDGVKPQGSGTTPTPRRTPPPTDPDAT